MLLLGAVKPLSVTQDFTLSENHTARPTNRSCKELMQVVVGCLPFVCVLWWSVVE